MKFFCVEWWHNEGSVYKQEYFLTFIAASARFVDLATNVPGSDPSIETLHMER